MKANIAALGCILVLLATAQPAHAGRLRAAFHAWCESLITDDPWPYALISTDDLLTLLEQTTGRLGTPVLNELIYRYRSKWAMTDEQRQRFMQILR